MANGTPPLEVPSERTPPYWWPTMQTFLAACIMAMMGIVIYAVLFRPPTMDERMTNIFMFILGALVSTMKDVFGYSFGSSAGSAAKDAAQSKMVMTLTGTGPGTGPANGAAVARAAALAAPAAAAAAAPPAAEIAAPPAAEVAVDKELDARGLGTTPPAPAKE